MRSLLSRPCKIWNAQGGNLSQLSGFIYFSKMISNRLLIREPTESCCKLIACLSGSLVMG